MFEYSASNRFAQPGKSKPGSLDICSNPNRAIEGQIFEMPFTGFGMVLERLRAHNLLEHKGAVELFMLMTDLS